jgi:hypothetical protein
VGDIEQRRDNEEKKLEGMDWCIGEYTIKKKQKKKKQPRREKTKLSVNAREEKKREVRGDWLVHFDNWNEDDKEMLSPVRREKKERWKETLFAFDRKKRERKNVYIPNQVNSTSHPTNLIAFIFP